jgi:predicted acylesterase/phospholipase RssA/CRP-like cAMP-binding protein
VGYGTALLTALAASAIAFALPSAAANNAADTPPVLNVFTLDTVQDVIKHQHRDRKKHASNSISQPSPSIKHAEEDSLSTLQMKLYIGCTKSISNLSIQEFKTIYAKTKWIHLDDSEIVYKIGDTCESGFYFLVEGSLKGFVEFGGNLVNVLNFSPGDCVGEWEIYGKDTLRKVTVIADGSCELINVPYSVFLQICEELPRVALSFMKTTVARQWRVAHFILRDFLNLIDDSSKENSNQVESCFCGKRSFDALDSFLDAKEIDALLKEIGQEQQFKVDAGDILYSEKSHSKSKLFVLLSGDLVAYCSNHSKPLFPDSHKINRDSSREKFKSCSIVKWGKGTVFGAASCIGGGMRLESVRALSESSLCWISMQQLNTVCKVLGRKLSEAIGRIFYPIISDFYQVGFERVWAPAGQILFSSGSPVDFLYIVVSGRVRLVSSRPDGTEKLIGEYGRGECVGEMAILAENHSHSLTVFAVRDTELVRISTKILPFAFKKHPRILEKLSSIMARRLRAITSDKSPADLKSSRVSTVAVIPIDSDLDVETFCENLKLALDTFGKTKWISSNDTLFKQEGDINDFIEDSLYRHKVTSILTDLEEAHDFLIFSANAEFSAWTQCCVRQADCVFIVSNAKSSHEVSDLENNLIWESTRKTFSRKELVLVHEDDTIIPSGTRKWFQDRKLHTFHHVKKTEQKGYKRLARHLANSTVGLVLGGGGARGLAHFGVMQALEENGFEIDFVGGTSQGAFMAGLFAYFVELPEVEKNCRAFASKMGNIWELLSDATFPVMSYFSGKRLNDQIINFFHDAKIEDLWIKYFCVTTNMTDADICIHQTGTLWKAIRASMSIIDYLPPMLIGSKFLIDGGYINNLPVDVMKDIYSPNIIVAVDVENKQSPSFGTVTNYGLYLSGWWLIMQKLKGFFNPLSKGTSIPRYSEIVYSLIYMNHNRNLRRFINEQFMDIYIRPDLGSAMLLDYHKFEEIRDLGNKFARFEISKFQQSRSKKSFHRRGISSSHTSMENVSFVFKA